MKSNTIDEIVNSYYYYSKRSTTSNIYIAKVCEFNFLVATGDTSQKAIKELKVAVKEIVEEMLASQEKIPSPIFVHFCYSKEGNNSK